MLRAVVSIVSTAAALASGAAEQRHSVDGAWVFEAMSAVALSL